MQYEATVLVIDNEPANLRVLFEQLERARFKVVIAEDGTGALNRIARLRPDIILLDALLPDTDGFELRRRLWAKEGMAGVPVIFLGLPVATADNRKDISLRAADYVNTPLEPKEVVARVETCLTIRNLQQRLEDQNTRLRQEIAERRQAEAILIRREANLATLSGIQQQLLDPGWKDAEYADVLEKLGKIADVSRSYLFVNSRDATGRLLMSQTAEWCAPGIDPQIDNPELQNMPYNDLPYWKEVLSRGNIINGLTTAIPEPARGILESQNILSILALPLAYKGEFSGFVGFDDCVKSREWGALDISLLQSAAAAISVAMERRRAENELKESHERFTAVMDRIAAVIYVADMETHEILFANQYLRDLLGDVEGKTCWRSLQTGKTGPCEFCTNKHLVKDGRPTGVYTWEFQNTVTQKWFKVNDQAIRWTDGRLVRMEIATEIDELKQAEEALRRAIGELKTREEQYRLLTETSILGIFSLDLSGNYVFANTAHAQLAGYTREELIGKHFSLIVGESMRKEGNRLFEKLLSGKSVRGEIVGRRKNGREFPASFSAAPIIKDDKIIGAIVVAQDITEKKQAEEALKESETRFRELSARQSVILDNTVIGIATVRARTIVWANRKMEEMFGYSADELKGMRTETLYSSHADYERLGQEAYPLLSKGLTYHDEWRMRRKNGAVLMCAISGKAIASSDSVEESIWILQDITERKQAEKALRESEERFALAMRGANDGLWDWNLETGHVYFSPSWKSMLGYAEHEIEPTLDAWKCLVHPDDLPPALERVEQYLSGIIDKYEIEFRMRHKDGHCVDILARASTLRRDSDGTLQRMVGTHVDITERKRAAKALKLAKDASEEARRAAERANRAKSEFLANMSHEIRTPMNAVLGFTELLDGRIIDPQQKSWLEAVKVGGKNLLGLIDDILDLSKIEAGKMEIRPEPTNLETMAHELRLIFKNGIEQKGLGFILGIESNIPENLLLDEVRLRQTLFNLIGNAVKFTDKGHVRLTIQTRPSSQPDRGDRLDVLIAVEDTGIGIPETERKIIFDPFTQLKGRQSAKHGGTGLGLAITKKLVEMMDGKISVESVAGGGSIFKIRLANVEIVEKTDPVKAPDRLDGQSIKFEPATIMVVDDEDNNRVLIKTILADTPLAVVESKNGEEALHLLGLKQNQEGRQSSIPKPDLILMDLRMPGKSGYETTEIIKKNDNFKHVPVIAVTASAMMDAEKKIEILFDGFVRKPFTRAELLSELKKHLPLTVGEAAPDTLEKAGQKTGLRKALSTKTISVLPELTRILENELLPKWEGIRETLIFQEVEAFANRSKTVGDTHGCALLTHWSETVINQMRQLDMENLPATFDMFPELINEISRLR